VFPQKGTVGATMRCEMADAGRHLGVTVTATDVEGPACASTKVDDYPR
jgi:hypothetical protein